MTIFHCYTCGGTHEQLAQLLACFKAKKGNPK